MGKGKMRVPKIIKRLQKKVDDDLDAISAEILDGILTAVPKESGHIHEAFCSAFESNTGSSYKDDEITEVLLKHDDARSGDLAAAKAGRVFYVRRKKGAKIRVRINLPFAAIMDAGGTIGVGSAGRGTGYKVGGMSTIGELNAPRLRTGPKGFLRWEDASGNVHWAKTRNLSYGAGFLEKGLSRGRSKATSLGWRKK